MLSEALHTDLSWHLLYDIRSLCRIRVGIVTLSHKNGCRSQARIQYCIFCAAAVPDPYLQAIMECARWADLRTAVRISTPAPRRVNRTAMLDQLNLLPNQRGFEQIVDLCAAIDKAATHFWRARG